MATLQCIEDMYYTKMKTKYKAIKTFVDGIRFDSKKEANRYVQLKMLEKNGIISNLSLQVPYTLSESTKYGRKIKYIADFVYEEDGKIIVEDVKGVKTPVYKLKKRLMAEKYGIVIKET